MTGEQLAGLLRLVERLADDIAMAHLEERLDEADADHLALQIARARLFLRPDASEKSVPRRLLSTDRLRESLASLGGSRLGRLLGYASHTGVLTRLAGSAKKGAES